MAIAMHTYTWTLQGVPNRWQRVPLNNPLGFKHNPLEGAGIYIYIFRCLLHRRGPQNQLFALIQFQWIFLGGWSTLYNHFLIYPVSFPIGIQSPNLRMGAWNLNTKSVSLR